MITEIYVTLNNYEGYNGRFDEDGHKKMIVKELKHHYPKAVVTVHDGHETSAFAESDSKGEPFESSDAEQVALSLVNETDPFWS